MKYEPIFTGEIIAVKPEHFTQAIKPKPDQRPDLNPQGEFELSNGIWLKSTGDGNYYDGEGARWNELELCLFDEDDEIIEQVYSFGFICERGI